MLSPLLAPTNGVEIDQYLEKRDFERKYLGTQWYSTSGKDAIGRKPDTVGKECSKIGIFSRSSHKFGMLVRRY